MKIPRSIRQLYEDQKAVNDRLRETVSQRMAGLRKEHWHYQCRVKELQSFALKIESGRVPKPNALEDFFACTLVVANTSEIAEAEEVVAKAFSVRQRRPKDTARTHKTADAFPFDDLRMYVKLRSGADVPPSDLNDVVFEVQIKTFLQHAWAIATHDLIYKADDANWSKARIAYQIKAMLEHAEAAIEEADRLADSKTLKRTDDRTKWLGEAIALLRAQWGEDELPKNVRRLAENVGDLVRALSLDIPTIRGVLDDGKARREGRHPANLSPYATVVQYLFESRREQFVKYLSDEQPKSKTKALISQEVELPADVDPARLRNAVWVWEGKPSVRP